MISKVREVDARAREQLAKANTVRQIERARQLRELKGGPQANFWLEYTMAVYNGPFSPPGIMRKSLMLRKPATGLEPVTC